MKISKNAQQQTVATKVNELLAAHKELKVPVDVARVAKKIKLKIVFEELDDDVSGFLITEENPCIGVNNKHPESRQRFTIAHEIAHFLLHANKTKTLFVDKPVYFRNIASSSGEYRQEIEANYFAAELLMPEQLLRKELGKYGDGLTETDVEELAKTFAVSSQAMGYRLTKLNLLRSF